ncbi:o-succinylbenzoate synthase [Shewanella gelidii]|uniref:o-succinylbenzoate synthase n=1 Tax=Shewanella gelidii TaxID=1642821 RepID=A0A917JR37_9GAMM|nr:o-succinylbenzoate synthase [Shewanella gelidii]MCL1098525.1 o-succinylbenzoate synthase [Shewanella gelidii]GGI82062.1 o-succinylbenzoate synthase [Shewanella gelidii]
MSEARSAAQPLISQLKIYRYQIPLVRPLPVAMQRIDHRSGLVLQVTLDSPSLPSKATGVGAGTVETLVVEVAPLSGDDITGNPLVGFSQEALEQVVRQLQRIAPKLTQQPISLLQSFAEQVSEPSLAYGLSLLHAKANHLLHPVRLASKAVPLVYQAPGESEADVIARIQALPADINAVKVKVAQTSMTQEITLIHHILAQRPKLTLRLDANRGFGLERAIEFCASLPLEHIEYIEEPCENPDDNLKLHQATGVSYAHDESLNTPGYDFKPLPGLTALVIKPMLWGSLSRLQTLIESAHEHGVRCILSSALEASLGIQDIANLAASLTPDEPPGIDTLAAFSKDLIHSSGKAQCLSLNDLQQIPNLPASSSSSTTSIQSV